MKDHNIRIDQLLSHLGRSGEQGRATLQLLIERDIKVDFKEQSTAARWTLTHNIQLHPRYVKSTPDDPYTLSLIVHEGRHLEQGIYTALSVYGELDAWQLQFSFIKSLTGQYHSNAHFDKVIKKLMSLSLGWNRGILRQARRCMRAYAGKGYRVDLLPLFPLPMEILFFITGKPK